MRREVSRKVVRMVASVSSSSARSALNRARIRDSASEDNENRPDWASEAIMARTAAASRPVASNKRRSKLDDTWMSIDGDEVATTSRTS